jgi:hypothetical protein
VFAFRLGGFVIASPALGPDGVVYAGSDDDRLYAIGVRLLTGSLTTAPVVDAVVPAAVLQGGEGAVRIEGLHFREGVELELGAGVEVGDVQVVSDRALQATIRVAAGARVGSREAVAREGVLRGTRPAGFEVEFDCRRADLSGDGLVDGLDLALLASRFGTAGEVSPVDLDGDGGVDGADLALLAAGFGRPAGGCR